MMNERNGKVFDLEDRTFEFARASRAFIKKLPRTIANIEDVKQFVRSSGSVGANYIEANEAIGKKDFLMKIRTCRREAKETRYWLRLIETTPAVTKERDSLVIEAGELMNIFGAIVRKSEKP
jgi:four helix bundle protein